MVVSPIFSRDDPQLHAWFAAERSMLNLRKAHLDELYANEYLEFDKLRNAYKKRYAELNRWSRNLIFVTGSTAILLAGFGLLMLFEEQQTMVCQKTT
jgi:hypothetical protein